MKTDAATSKLPDATLWLILACGIVAALHLGKAAIAAPLLQADLQLGLTEVGWLAGIFAVLGLIGGAPVGIMAATFGNRRAVLLGLFTMAVSGIIGTIMPSYWTLLVSRLAEGFGFLLVIVGGPALLQSLSNGAKRDMALSLWSCFMPLGMALAMLTGPLFQSWQAFWWASSALGITVAVAVLSCVPGDKLSNAASERTGWRVCGELFSSAAPLLAVSFALYSLMFFALFSFLPVLLDERMSVSRASAGLLMALASAANAVGNLAAGYLLAKGAGRGPLIAVASAIMGGTGLAIFSGQFQPHTTLILCVLFSAVGGLIPATLLASVPRLASRSALVPIAVGLIMQGSNLGQLLGPVIVGTVTTAYGWGAAGVVVGVTSVVGCAVAVLLQGSPDRQSKSL